MLHLLPQFQYLELSLCIDMHTDILALNFHFSGLFYRKCLAHSIYQLTTDNWIFRMLILRTNGCESMKYSSHNCQQLSVYKLPNNVSK